MPATNPTQRFSSRVDNYLRYRPSYPPEVLETLRKHCGLAPRSIIADIGSGTGLLTRIFLENGNQVFGVEPNAEMRAAGERFLAGYPGFRSVAGTAESTTLSDHSVDLVTAAQAAHWFDWDRARAEFIRILKPSGWAVLVWNERCTDSTAFLREYEHLLLTYGTDYSEVRHERTTSALDMFFAPTPFEARVFKYQQKFDYTALEGRLLSSSYTPQQYDPRYEPMIGELRKIFDRYQLGSRVVFEYNTRLYYGQLR